MIPAMPAPSDLSPAARRTALVVSRLMLYLGLVLGMALGAGAITILFTDKIAFTAPAERWLTGAVFAGLAIMAFGFSSIGKARIEKLK